MSQSISPHPWMVEVPPRRPPANLIIKDAEARHIAYITAPIASYPVAAVDLPEMIANARLMAAAPQLLEAARLALCASRRPISPDEARVLGHVAALAIYNAGATAHPNPERG